ncbi:hypothetical protein [Bradyrhizobium tropiciagri]|nr:hypothetical protein [Bradyrhizobium tropiciagri]
MTDALKTRGLMDTRIDFLAQPTASHDKGQQKLRLADVLELFELMR